MTPTWPPHPGNTKGHSGSPSLCMLHFLWTFQFVTCRLHGRIKGGHDFVPCYWPSKIMSEDRRAIHHTPFIFNYLFAGCLYKLSSVCYVLCGHIHHLVCLVFSPGIVFSHLCIFFSHLGIVFSHFELTFRTMNFWLS